MYEYVTDEEYNAIVADRTRNGQFVVDDCKVSCISV